MSQQDSAGFRPEPRRPTKWMLDWFRWYCRRYLAENFHGLRLSGPRPTCGSEPVIVALNHPSWWDPLVAGILSEEFFPGRSHYGPIDAAAFNQYGFFKYLGLFGVEQGTRAGAASFLRDSTVVLQRPNSSLWITVQGRFSDPRERPVRVRPGIGHLARRMPSATILPLAFEYPFWEERFPEILIRFGTPISLHEQRSAADWSRLVETRLTETMDALAAEALTRDLTRFQLLVGGKTGVGGVYDLWRRFRSLARGGRFRSSHGADDRSVDKGAS